MVKLNLRKFGVLLPPIFLGLAAGIALIFDIARESDSASTRPIGKVARIEKRVRYKHKGDIVWKNAQAGQVLYLGDSMIVGPDSFAVIDTENGEKLEVHSDSYVRLDDPKEFKGHGAKGSIRVRNSDGTERELGDAGDRLGASQTGARLLFPEEFSDLAQITTAGKDAQPTPVTFTWKLGSDSTLHPKFLQIGSNKLFEPSQVSEFPLNAEQTGVDIPVPAGKKFWRLIDDKRRPVSVTREFQIHQVEAIRGESPKGETESWDSVIEFRWVPPHKGPEMPGSHWLEISDDPGFTNLILKDAIPIHSIHFVVHDLKPGRHYWRIASRYGETILAGAPLDFTIRTGHQLTIDKLSPPPHATFEAGSNVVFHWDINAVSSQQVLEVEAPGQPQRQIPSTQMGEVLKAADAGHYRWRVVARLGQLHSESEWRDFAVVKPGGIEITHPSSGATIEISPFDTALTFEWRDRSESTASVSMFLVEIASDPNFQQVVASKRSKVPRLSGAEFYFAGNQTYFWRVISQDKTGGAIALSNVSSFAIKLREKLRAPQDLFPQAGVTCTPFRKQSPCMFSWTAVAGAKAYEIEFTRADPQERGPATSEALKPSLRKTVSTTGFDGKNLPEGTYSWRVRALDEKNREGDISAPQLINISFGPRVRAPRARAPEVQ